MTKEEKRNLTWKLKELPTASELADLVDAGILKPEEAREMVVGTKQHDKDKIVALEKMVEFLQGVVTELSKNRPTYTPIQKTVYIDRAVRPYWNQLWMNTANALSNDVSLTSHTAGNFATSAVNYVNTGTGKSVTSASSNGEMLNLTIK